MKKTTAAIIALSILIVCAFAGCKGTESGKITDKSTEKMTTASNPQEESSSRTGGEQLITEVRTRLDELGSDAESKAEELKTDAQSAVSDLFNETGKTNVNS